MASNGRKAQWSCCYIAIELSVFRAGAPRQHACPTRAGAPRGVAAAPPPGPCRGPARIVRIAVHAADNAAGRSGRTGPEYCFGKRLFVIAMVADGWWVCPQRNREDVHVLTHSSRSSNSPNQPLEHSFVGLVTRPVHPLGPASRDRAEVLECA